MRSVSAMHHYLFDLLIFSTCMVAAVLGFHNSGLEPDVRYLQHELVSLGASILVFVHLLSHWQWLIAFLNTPNKERTKNRTDLILAIVLLVLFAVLNISGVLIADLFGNMAAEQRIVTGIHHLTAKLSIVIVIIHLFRKRRWLVYQTQKLW